MLKQLGRITKAGGYGSPRSRGRRLRCLQGRSPMLTEASDYETLYRDFRWEIPDAAQPRHRVLRPPCRWQRPARADLCRRGWRARRGPRSMRWPRFSRRFANVLKADGLVRGDRVAVFLSQSLELPIAHLAAFRSGMVSIPLFALFGEDALEFRLSNSGAKAIVTDAAGYDKLAKIRDRLAGPEKHLCHRRCGACRDKIVLVAAEGGIRRFRDRRYLGRRSRADHLHVGHHGKPEGRAACAPRGARPSAECRDVPRFPAQARRPDVDAGRLGLDRRADQRAVRGLVSRACRSSAIARANSSRRRRWR